MSLYYFPFLGEKIKVCEKWNELLKAAGARPAFDLLSAQRKTLPTLLRALTNTEKTFTNQGANDFYNLCYSARFIFF